MLSTHCRVWSPWWWVWAWQDTDSSSVLSCCIIKDSRSPESRHSQTKGPLWHGLHMATWDHPLLSGWQLVTLAIVLQPGHPSWLTPYSGSGGVEPTGRTHGGRWEHSVTLNDIHQLIIGFSQTCTTSGNIGCFSSTPNFHPCIELRLYLAWALLCFISH